MRIERPRTILFYFIYYIRFKRERRLLQRLLVRN